MDSFPGIAKVDRHNFSAVIVTLRRLSVILLLSASGWAHPVTYHAQIEQSQWYLSASIFECSLTHTIPEFGTGVFYHEAGEPLKFFLQAKNNPLREGRGAFVIESPDWLPGRIPHDLGYVDVLKSNRPITVGEQDSSMMMASLMEGMAPTFTRKAWYSDDSVRVRINAVNFRNHYEDYMACVSTLLPVNFKQVERSLVLFEVDKAILTKEDYQVLDNVIIYVKADKTVSSIYVDGHTDSSGRRIYNRRLSKDRAETVTQYLLEHGIANDMITTRYHGERYPAVSNATKDSRSRNRRSTVRLERGPRVMRKPPTQVDSEDGATIDPRGS